VIHCGSVFFARRRRPHHNRRSDPPNRSYLKAGRRRVNRRVVHRIKLILITDINVPMG
jgi:hypothetical protein